MLEIRDTSLLDDSHQVQQVVADDTANVEVALWQEFVDALSLGKSYQLDLRVKTFNERISIHTPTVCQYQSKLMICKMSR